MKLTLAKGFLAIVAVLFFASAGMTGVVYWWVDEQGVVNFTDSEELVPKKHRGHMKRMVMPERAKPSPRSTQEVQRVTKESTDRYGRGKEYWGNRVREAREALIQAQIEYRRLRGEYREASRGWEEATSTAERDEYKKGMKLLEEESDKQREEIYGAKEFLEITLPDEAAKAEAPLEWLK